MKAFLQQLRNLWKELGLNQRVSLVLAAGVVIIGMGALVTWSNRPDYQPRPRSVRPPPPAVT